ncbi:MAG: AAA family ATPase [Actinobacteria bacterium]|nr:AAA family ATPase [Actinomycetota bacterium]
MTTLKSAWDGPPPEDDPTGTQNVRPLVPQEDEPVSRRTWQPVDLSDVLSGSWVPPEPVVGQRSDGVGLFYPGKVHTVSSESEAGKTWLLLSACVDELLAGRHVLYLDFEDDEGGVTQRLLGLQVTADVILERFHYVRPTEALGAGIHLDDLRHLLDAHSPSLAVLDGVTEAMTLHGMDPLSNKDIAMFGRMLPRRIADLGPAVVCLDHVVKSAESRGRYAMGGVSAFYGKAATLNRDGSIKAKGRGFYEARRVAGRDDLNFHALRHTGATLAAQTGATLAELMGRLGHSTPGAAMRYQHAAKERDQEIARKLSAMVEGIE